MYKQVSKVETDCNWNSACDTLIDTKLRQDKKLDLWGILFRSSFDQLVHNLLEYSYNNLDKKISGAIERICSSAPSYKEIHAQDVSKNVTNIVNYLQALLANLVNESMNLVHLECAEESSIRYV